ncbi:hypothetical protein [Streptomyces sp. cg36]|uniref:hypothetical protein n=1 Tax=Streptomyces sp. cg36 TaxID=3238798 RepID=UPI0034E1DA73
MERDVLSSSSCCGSLAKLLTATNLDTYLTSAADNQLKPDRTLRLPGQDGYRPPTRSSHSRKARISVLGRIARTAGLKIPVRARDIAPPQPGPDTYQRGVLGRYAATLPAPPDTPETDGTRAQWVRWRVAVRTQAILAVTLDTGAQSGEHAAMTLDGLAADLSTITFERRPRGSRTRTTATLPLSPPTRRILKRWLDVRQTLTSRLSGSPVTTLWVTCSQGEGGPPHADRGRRPPGMPITPGAMLVQHTRAMQWLNADPTRHPPGWQPVGHTLAALGQQPTGNPNGPTPRGGEPPQRPAATAA